MKCFRQSEKSPPANGGLTQSLTAAGQALLPSHCDLPGCVLARPGHQLIFPRAREGRKFGNHGGSQSGERFHSWHLPIPQPAFPRILCIRPGPGTDGFPSYYFSIKKCEDTNFHYPVKIKFCEMTGLGRGPGRLPPPFRGRLQGTFSTFSSPRCLAARHGCQRLRKYNFPPSSPSSASHHPSLSDVTCLQSPEPLFNFPFITHYSINLGSVFR